jgi:hypothetical protein
MPEVVGLKDVRTNYHKEVVQGVELGPLSSTYQAIQANNMTSTSSVTYSIIPPGLNSGIGRFMRCHIVGFFDITFNVDPTITDQAIALRQWPINSIISTCTAQINNTAISLSNVAQLVPVVSRIANSFANMNSFQSGTPTTPDVYTRYDQTIGTYASPFASDNILGDVQQGRRAQITSIIKAGAANTIRVAFDIVEPLLNPLFQADNEAVVSLVGVNTLNINVNYANVWKMLSLAQIAAPTAAATVVSITPTFTKQEVYVNFVTGSDLTFKDSPSYYSCPNIRFDVAASSPATAVDVGSTIQASSANIQLQKVPRYLVIWVTPLNTISDQAPGAGALANSRGGCGLVDLILPITQISISAYDKAGLLSGSQPAQLYSMSCMAGLTNCTFPQYLSSPVLAYTGLPARRYNSAPIVIPMSNLSLQLGLAPDSDESSTFQAQVTFQYLGGLLNAAGAEVALPGYQINVMSVIDGILELNAGQSTYVYGGLQREQVMHAIEASRNETLIIDAIRKQSMIMGAGFWDKIKSAYNWTKEHVAPIAKAIYDHGGKQIVHSALKGVAPEAEMALTALGGARMRLRQHPQHGQRY